MRARDLDKLEAVEHDLLVVGGGIHGLAAAYDAASRGLQVALVEAADFGSGASFHHQKTAHGGLRALSTLSLGRARHMIHERRALARIAPWCLRPLPFIVGTYRSAMRSRPALRAAFAIDAWLGRRRNDGIADELHLPAPKLLSRSQTLKFFPGIEPRGLTGGAQWYDYQMAENDRLTLAFAAAADRAGAYLGNYVEALEPIREGGAISGMQVRDALTGRTFAVRARVTLNAAGSRAGAVMRTFGVQRPFPLLKAMNLVTTKRASDIALAAPAASGRMLTLVPWRGRALVGTGQSERFVDESETAVTTSELAAFIAEANQAFPALGLRTEDVSLVHRGVLPAVQRRNGRADLLPDAQIIDHASEGAPGAITMVGVKFVTARGVAEHAVHAVARRLGRRLPPSRTASIVLPGAGIGDHEGLAIETARDARLDVPLPTLTRLAARYAEAAAEIVRLMAEREELRQPVDATAVTIGAEIVHAIRREAAMRLSDIVIRRTGLGAAGQPGAEALAACARIAAAELGWDAAHQADEILAVERFYALTGGSSNRV
jgi:glycerol-3-phosphate dehydrogenase